MTLGLSGTSAAGQPTAPPFVLFVGGLAVVFGALMVWVELLIRAAAVYVAVLFLPLALASLAWPAIAHWCRRLVDTLVALVLGKFVIVSVLSLAAGALAGGTGSGSAGGSGSPGGEAGSPGAGHSGGGGFAAVLGGAALLLFAAFAPWALFRLLPFLEAGAVGHLESLSHRFHQSAGAPARGLARTAMLATGAGCGGRRASGSVGGLVGGSGRAGLGGAGEWRDLAGWADLAVDSAVDWRAPKQVLGEMGLPGRGRTPGLRRLSPPEWGRRSLRARASPHGRSTPRPRRRPAAPRGVMARGAGPGPPIPVDAHPWGRGRTRPSRSAARDIGLRAPAAPRRSLPPTAALDTSSSCPGRWEPT